LPTVTPGGRSGERPRTEPPGTNLSPVAISPYIRRLREIVGHELLVLPSAAVLPKDKHGRILLVRIADTGQWAAIGGAIEPDEFPEESALREAQEEAGVSIRLGPILGVVGGPEFRMTYPNGDQTSYVSTVFDATVIGGTPTPDGDETTTAEWWDAKALPYDEMSSFTRALLRDVGLSPAPTP
jgi:8-oxo-dGTP pyrophosphatase MutT (NUDIX family)